MVQIPNIRWLYTSELFDRCLSDPAFLIEPLQSGLEGEVYKISWPAFHFSTVFKVWNRSSKQDPMKQLSVLQHLREFGVPVSEVYGCGYDDVGSPILVTSFDGRPLADSEGHDVSVFAKLLAQIHRLPANRFPLEIPDKATVFDRLIHYFFPSLSLHPDLQEAVHSIVPRITPMDVSVIHGDFNLGNIVHQGERYCILDWTNAQVSDGRYDLAWAAFLIKIYMNDNVYHKFKESYFHERSMGSIDYPLFEMLGFLRWLLLHRMANLPMKEDTFAKIKRFRDENKSILGGVVL